MARQAAIPARRLYAGCAIWAYKGWVGSFYPVKTKAADFLREYSRRLTAVEGNTTFYAVPSAESVKRWAEQTPPGFNFCPKFPKAITHERRLKEAGAEAGLFLERMSGLGDRLGPLFIQLPPSFGQSSADVLAAFLAGLPGGYRIAVEVRHPDWFTQAGRRRLNALLEQHHTARVIVDTRGLREGESADVRVNQSRERKPDLPIHPDLTSHFAFVRLILNPRSDLNEPYLAEWTERIAGWLETGVQVFLFCHCPDEVQSPTYARLLHARIAARTAVEPLRGEPEQSALL